MFIQFSGQRAEMGGVVASEDELFRQVAAMLGRKPARQRGEIGGGLGRAEVECHGGPGQGGGFPNQAFVMRWLKFGQAFAQQVGDGGGGNAGMASIHGRAPQRTGRGVSGAAENRQTIARDYAVLIAAAQVRRTGSVALCALRCLDWLGSVVSPACALRPWAAMRLSFAYSRTVHIERVLHDARNLPIRFIEPAAELVQEDWLAAE